MVNDSIDYYNNGRRQWNLKKLAPIDYRYQLVAT
ncbi:IS3 family transposase [Enterococcus lemanii]|uniref:IS3 family transposase n=1 Tax=Enterococcus lemanii TaxID=1159752 RepID=A0ABV9MVI1_9ENTE|nr:IS3 family transposase [Enterococcus sp.]